MTSSSFLHTKTKIERRDFGSSTDEDERYEAFATEIFAFDDDMPRNGPMQPRSPDTTTVTTAPHRFLFHVTFPMKFIRGFAGGGIGYEFDHRLFFCLPPEDVKVNLIDDGHSSIEDVDIRRMRGVCNMTKRGLRSRLQSFQLTRETRGSRTSRTIGIPKNSWRQW